jgi:hypothetical protein
MNRLLALLAGLLLALPLRAEPPEAFITAAIEGMKQQADAHAATWGLGKAKRWSADLDKGVLRFEFADGTLAEAPLQVVGTYNTENGSFLWAWDHPSVPAPLRQHAELARQWGEREGVPKFNTRQVRCSEEEAWAFAAVTNRLAKAQGVYRGPTGAVRVFMTFGDVTLTRPPGK